MEDNLALYRTTLGNPIWLAKNHAAIENAFPLEWTTASMEVVLRVGFTLKTCGAIWRDFEQLSFFMTRFVQMGWAELREIPGAMPQIRQRRLTADRAVQQVLNTTPTEAVVAQANDVINQFRLPPKS